MDPAVKRAILRVLREIQPYVKNLNAAKLKDMSSLTIANGSIYQDEDSISIAVVTYALSKIIERVHLKKPEHWKNFHQHILDNLNYAKNHLTKNKTMQYRNAIKNLFSTINQLDSKLALYIQEVVEKSKIKKGTSLYEHGISIARVCELLDICNWELMDYVGKTQISDSEKDITSALSRLKLTKKMFGI